ncbi:MAG: hypothetical protein A2061_04385 [Gallionellales bacterium GWA2_59_43]|nr:MAG: hypothetical protein A2061_04385 [Gallionellales bacterium GWA2_59_43]
MSTARPIPQNLAEIAALPVADYRDIRAELRTGDLLFCIGAKPVSRAVQRITHSPYSHVALVVRMLSIDRILLLGAEWPYGVRVVSLSSYLSDWNGSGKPYPGHLVVGRHSGLDLKCDEVLKIFLSELIDVLGQRYSLRRVLRMGLRELAARIGLRFRRLRIKKATVCSEYVHHAMSRLGIKIRWNHKGYILPTDIAADPEVVLVCRLL